MAVSDRTIEIVGRLLRERLRDIPEPPPSPFCDPPAYWNHPLYRFSKAPYWAATAATKCVHCRGTGWKDGVEPDHEAGELW